MMDTYLTQKRSDSFMLALWRILRREEKDRRKYSKIMYKLRAYWANYE